MNDEGLAVELLTWIFQYGLILLGAGLIVVGVLAFSGRWRRWVFHPRTLLAVVPYNVFPLCLGFLGVGLTFLGLSFNTGEGWVPGDAQVYDALAWVGFALALVSFIWWPQSLMPGWHRDWMRRGGDDVTSPWPTDREREEGHR